mgnify:FL=1
MIHLLLAVIYVSFISLGLPDSLLGAAWPSIYPGLGVPVSYSGVIFCIISVGTVFSSLQSDRMTRRFGAGGVTAISVAMTAAALFGFSVSSSFWAMCLWAIPYGLGAGSVDAALNNYVALHFASRHMSWLHCMWGIGASVGPYIMGAALSSRAGWQTGYRVISVMQMVLTIIILLSLPLWKTKSGANAEEREAAPAEALTLKQIFRISGVKEVLVTFFCYCSLEQTTSLWASSYLVLNRGIAPETAAGFASLFFVGITVGRALCGFLTLKFDDTQMVRMGQGIIAIGITAFLLPLGEAVTLAGLLLVGLGCAPIYPSIIHATPGRFGADRSQAIIGVQMASAYIGNCLMPPLFGVIANHTTIAIFPYYLLVILILMGYMHEALQRKRSGAIKYRCSCIWKNAQEQRYFCTHIIPRLHRNSRLQHTTILDVALGENLYSDGPDRWGSLACMRRQASSFTSSMITAVRGIKKMIPMMPKSFPPIIAATRVYSGESPTDFPTTRG